ncbi:MAG TPA: GGDEF domain-containing protein [Acidimicrobiales bacterium]|nr:GGDEF domain-containing protein [Acidimicrobiales bacterium]
MDRRKELLAAWERRSQARGDAEHCTGADALFLVTALSTALRRASETPELGRAARTWGVRFSAPVEALASLGVLRDALVELADASNGGLPVPLSVLNRIFDQAALEAVDAASANLRSEARNDPLTGCANRRALEEDLVHALSSARRSGLDLAVAVVDLDGLKQINDGQGHGAGDAALIGLVATLRRALREADTLYRTGGDEFVVVAPFTDAAGARALMRRAERVAGPAFSWGVASLASVPAAPAPAHDPALLMEAADSDLYLRRRSSRQAAAVAARRRRVTAAASVAASVVVTASMAGLAVALDSGSSAPATHGVSASGAPPADWRASSLGSPSPGSRRFGTAPVGSRIQGGAGTSLAGLLDTTVAPAPGAVPEPSTSAPVPVVLVPSSPSGAAQVTLVSAVTPSHPIALASVAPPPPAPTHNAPGQATGAAAPATAPGHWHGNGSGGGNGNGNGNGNAGHGSGGHGSPKH